STPKDFTTRLAAVEQRSVETRGMLRARGTNVFSPDAVCGRPTEVEANALQQELATYGARLNLRLSGLTIAPEVTTTEGLAAIRLRFQASGSYESALLALDQLAKRRPQVFADSVDLTSKTSSVTLVFSGRLFCSV
ncbi:GspMb/PilO family protein, partial [Bosea sp. (in: a-proteobacteria)]|uniref:GspMb/PilO family protein n=1 Tax=Bosea sp. (in: a-proteobacteria) TaxID=1871050 RepID=UPI00121DD3B4